MPSKAEAAIIILVFHDSYKAEKRLYEINWPTKPQHWIAPLSVCLMLDV